MKKNLELCTLIENKLKESVTPLQDRDRIKLAELLANSIMQKFYLVPYLSQPPLEE